MVFSTVCFCLGFGVLGLGFRVEGLPREALLMGSHSMNTHLTQQSLFFASKALFPKEPFTGALFREETSILKNAANVGHSMNILHNRAFHSHPRLRMPLDFKCQSFFAVESPKEV